jgi:hypothetical protein
MLRASQAYGTLPIFAGIYNRVSEDTKSDTYNDGPTIVVETLGILKAFELEVL